MVAYYNSTTKLSLEDGLYVSLLKYRYTHATDQNRKILFDAFLLLTSKCFTKASIPVAILKIGKEKHRGECHGPAATQRHSHKENLGLLHHPAVSTREFK